MDAIDQRKNPCFTHGFQRAVNPSELRPKLPHSRLAMGEIRLAPSIPSRAPEAYSGPTDRRSSRHSDREFCPLAVKAWVVFHPDRSAGTDTPASDIRVLFEGTRAPLPRSASNCDRPFQQIRFRRYRDSPRDDLSNLSPSRREA